MTNKFDPGYAGDAVIEFGLDQIEHIAGEGSHVALVAGTFNLERKIENTLNSHL